MNIPDLKCPRAVIFDLDGTLADALIPPTREITERLERLLKILPVAIMSAASFKRIQERVLPHIMSPHNSKGFYVFADTSSQCYQCSDSEWITLYSTKFSESEKETINAALLEGIHYVELLEPDETFSIDVRDAQVTFAALKADAPFEEKKLWDPDQAKRKKLKNFLAQRIPAFDATIGGWRSIDITRSGLDKAHGVTWFAQRLGASPAELLFIGDAFHPGGNDFPVLSTGVQTIQVAGPHETEKVIDQILEKCTAR